MSVQRKPGFAKAYGFGLVTFALFLLSWSGQFAFQLMEVRSEAETHGVPFSWSESDARLEEKVDALLRERGIDPASIDEDVDAHLPRG